MTPKTNRIQDANDKMPFVRVSRIWITCTIIFLGIILSRAADNSELKIGMTQEFESLNPITMGMYADRYVHCLVNRGLHKLNAEGTLVEELAVETPTLENGLAEFFEEDGKRKLKSHWEIKEEAVWGDGVPVTGYDLELARKVALADTVSTTRREQYEEIDRIVIDPINPKKFDLIFDAPKFDYFRRYLNYLLPAHIEGPIFERHRGEPLAYDKNSAYVTDPTNPGLYNGPYRVADISMGSHATVVSNEKWWGNKASVQKIIVRFIPNTATLEANLISGTLDMISTVGLTFDQALAFEKRAIEQNLAFSVNFSPPSFYEKICLKMDENEILRDIRVRKALVHAIDRDLLCETLFGGKQMKALHCFVPLDPWYIDDPDKIVFYRYSKRLANRLLDEAGWAMGDDGIRHKDGKKLVFQFMTTVGDKTRENVEVFMQSAWKDVGIEITIKNEPARVFFGETLRRRQFPAMAMFADTEDLQHSPREMVHSAFIPLEKNSYSGANRAGWNNPEVDRLIDALEVEFDFEKRRELAHQFLYHYTDEVPYIPLYYRTEISVTPKKLKGYQLSFGASMPTDFAEYWNFDN